MGWARVQWPRIDAVFDRLPVALEIVPEPLELATAALAVPLASMSGQLEITPEGWASHLAQLFGASDLQLGDEAFDRAYVVKTTDEALAHALLPVGVRAEALVLGCRRIVYDDGSEHGHPPLVMIELPGVVVNPEVLDRMMRLVALLARAQRTSDSPYR
jgi:hypothetical protein